MTVKLDNLYESTGRLKAGGVLMDTYGGECEIDDPDGTALSDFTEYIYVRRAKGRPGSKRELGPRERSRT